jgi:hypothetical protein
LAHGLTALGFSFFLSPQHRPRKRLKSWRAARDNFARYNLNSPLEIEGALRPITDAESGRQPCGGSSGGGAFSEAIEKRVLAATGTRRLTGRMNLV